MKLSILVKKLNDILLKNGDCDVYVWNSDLCEHIKPQYAKYVYSDMIKEELLELPEYKEDFDKILHNVIIE